MNDSEERHPSDIDDDMPRPDKAPSEIAVGLTAWGCLLPNLALCTLLFYLIFSASGMGEPASVLLFVAFVIFLLLMIFLLRNRSRGILIASLIIGIGFWLLMLGLCVGAIGGA